MWSRKDIKNTSKAGMSIAALGPKLAGLCVMIGFLASNVLTGGIVAGVLGGAAVLIGAGMVGYAEYQSWKISSQKQTTELTTDTGITNQNRLTYTRIPNPYIQPAIQTKQTKSIPLVQRKAKADSWMSLFFNSGRSNSEENDSHKLSLMSRRF